MSGIHEFISKWQTLATLGVCDLDYLEVSWGTNSN